MGMWRPNKGKGWAQRQEAEPVNRFTQILRTVLEVVPGGVIRYGKTGPDDDAHTGFWLGVTPQGVAKFSIGGPGGWLKWDGSRLLIRGSLSTWTGASWPDWIEWVGGDEETVGYIYATDSWGHILEIGVPRSIGAGDRRAGDARYVRKTGGWSGMFRTGNVPPDEINTVTVVDGQVVAVA